MKIRAILWEETEASGTNSRRGPVREHTQTHQAVNDLNKLKKHAMPGSEGTVIDERDDHWQGPVDTIF